MTNPKSQLLAQSVIDALEGEDDHFQLIAEVTQNLVQYLADTVQN